jgi:hypothetical protein
MMKPSETLFDGKPENWPTFEDHIMKEAENQTIGWSTYILIFKVMGHGDPTNFLRSYINIPKKRLMY